ncbi:MAG: protein kinase domain-containing protein [Stackebrandtia sp.]
MPATSTVGAVELGRLLHHDPAASVHTGTLVNGHTPVMVTIANRRIDSSAREVFLDWATRLTRLATHPHIAPVASVGLTDNALPFVAVTATRTTLADVLRESGPPPAGQVRALGVALADALASIHSSGLIHGALQPATVLSGPGRKLLVAGFDATAPALAHPLPAGPYTAPEHLDTSQAGPVCASPAGDVYSLATLLYGALGGQLPWLSSAGQNPADPLLRAVPVPDIPSVSMALTDVLSAALSCDPKQRPDAGRLRDLLANVDVSRPLLAGKRPAAVSPDLVPRSGPRPTALPGDATLALPSKRHRKRRRASIRIGRTVKLAAAGVAAFLSVGGAGLATFAATNADASPSCPDRENVTAAVQQSYRGAKVVGADCEEDGYVSVTAQLEEGDAAESETVRLALRSSDGELRVLDGCDDDMPQRLREHLEC